MRTKNLLLEILLIVLLFLALVIATYGDSHYHTTAKVYNKIDNETLIVDSAGYVWAVTNRDDLQLNNFVEIYFNNNCTDYTRKDDKIVKIKILDN